MRKPAMPKKPLPKMAPPFGKPKMGAKCPKCGKAPCRCK